MMSLLFSTFPQRQDLKKDQLYYLMNCPVKRAYFYLARHGMFTHPFKRIYIYIYIYNIFYPYRISFYLTPKTNINAHVKPLSHRLSYDDVVHFHHPQQNFRRPQVKIQHFLHHVDVKSPLTFDALSV